MKIELSCFKCGSNRFVFPLKLTNEGLVICADCDHEIGTVADLQKKLIEELARRPTA